MSDDMHAQKMSMRFDMFDRDHDGYVSQGDVEQVARDILAEFGISPDWGKGRALLRVAGAYWRSMTEEAEAGPNGQLTRQEWIAASKRALLDDPEGFVRIIRPWTEASIAIADTDGDGEITLEEWARLLRAIGSNDAAISRRLKATDTDGDGRINVRDVLATARAFYTTNDDMSDFEEV